MATKWPILFCVLFLPVEAAQNTPSYNPAKVLLSVREKVIAALDRLPNYLCTEAIDRSVSVPPRGVLEGLKLQNPGQGAAGRACSYLAEQTNKQDWTIQLGESDHLAADVAFSRDGETYSPAGKNRFPNRGLADLVRNRVGATSTGAFGGFLSGIFAADGATFAYLGRITHNGRDLVEYGFSVSLESGGYSLSSKIFDASFSRATGDKTFTAIVPYHGTFLVDPKTFDLVRLVVQAEAMPEQLRLCEVTTTIDYSTVQLNKQQFLLPASVRLRVMNDDGSVAETSSVFSGCREFVGQSTLRFDSPPAANQISRVAVVPNALPELSPSQEELLLAVRKNAFETLKRLPKYLCTETVDRSTFQPQSTGSSHSCGDLAKVRSQKNWKVRQSSSDRLRLDVAVSSEDGEMYSWVGENRFGDRSLSDLVGGGVTSTGSFGAILGAIFGSTAANFTYEGDKDLNGRKVVEFGFSVPRDKSAFSIGTRSFTSVVPYRGSVFVDPKTFDLVRLVVRADQLPEKLRACEDTTTLDYAATTLSGAKVLLPENVVLRVVSDDGRESVNRTVFSGCHEFHGESTLSFDVAAEGKPATSETPPTPLVLPPGLHFTIALTDPIKTQSAAAGDAITAKLTSRIREKDGKILVEKGALVRGRIVQMARFYNPPSLVMELRLETIERNGVSWPFAAKVSDGVRSSADTTATTTPWKLGTFEEMSQMQSSAGILRFGNVGANYVVPKGWRLEGRTELQ